MENDIKQHTLVFDKGLTNSPSDLLCDDDSLEICDGMTQVDGEWKAIQRPKAVDVDVTGELVLVHRGQSLCNYISINDVSTETATAFDIYYTAYPDGTPTKIGDTMQHSFKGIQSVGNTLIVNTDNGMYYYLWRTNNYESLGNSIPVPIFTAAFSDDYDQYQSTVDIDGMDEHEWDDEEPTKMQITADSYSDFENACVGIYEETKNKIAKDKKFCNPFFIRCALEMHDGSYVNTTSPVLVMPCIDGNILYWNYNCAVSKKWKYESLAWDEVAVRRITKMNVHVVANSLKVIQTQDYSKFSDIVKDVVVFITKPVERCKFKKITADSTYNEYIYENISKETIYNKNIVFFPISTGGDPYASYSRKFLPASDRNVDVYETKSSTDIANELVSNSIFYKLCSIGSAKMTERKAISECMNDGVLENITTQEVLTDGYYDKCALIPEAMYTFNRRLNITGVSRSFFDGYVNFSNLRYVQKDTSVDEYKEDDDREFKGYFIYVKIETPTGDRVVRAVHMLYNKEAFYNNGWFFYPDTRATNAYIVDIGTKNLVASYTLKEHPRLNGAYSFISLPTLDDLIYSASGTSPIGDDDRNKTPELLSNYVIQSEVDNPFTFLSSGYVRVGQGEVIGMSGLTTALSQDAYKVATTICFTTQGIWALKIDSTGQYAEVAPPFSREVCVNAKLITMTDNAVFFASRKGLMCVTGTNEASVVCVSENIKNDYDFLSMLELDTTQIAYDYISGLIFFLDGMDDVSNFVYNIKTNTWSSMSNVMKGTFKLCVSDYPDTLLQNTDGKIFSLYNKPHRTQEEDTSTYNCLLTSRPIKFEGAMILKSLRQIKHLKSLHNGTLKFQISGTNELKTVGGWNILGSVTKDCATWETTESTGSLKGKPWRYYKLEYTFTNIKASDSFIGTVVVTQSRHTDKLR